MTPLPHRAPEELGRPSRKAAAAAMEAHRKVLDGEPLRRAIAEALAEAKGLGGQERRFAALACRELSRHQRLLDAFAKKLGQAPGDAALREDAIIVRFLLWRRIVCATPWERFAHEVKLPGPLRPRSIRDDALERLATAELPELGVDLGSIEGLATLHSYPRWLSEALCAEVPADERGALLESINREPEAIFRARPPGTREEVLAALAVEGLRAEPLPQAPDALRVLDRGTRVFDSGPAKAHRLESQDLGSQLIVECCRPAPGASLEGAKVADVCAGAGGKTLALADRVGPKGTVLAGDVSSRRLNDARDRVRELRLANVRFAAPADPKHEQVILVDAPCSGTGSLRREPDQKWKLTEKSVAEVVKKQAALLDQVAQAARPGALIVYATCSLLSAENEAQVTAFLGRHPGFELEDCRPLVGDAVCRGPYLRTFPHRTPGGGFFAARLRKRGQPD